MLHVVVLVGSSDTWGSWSKLFTAYMVGLSYSVVIHGRSILPACIVCVTSASRGCDGRALGHVGALGLGLVPVNLVPF